ncbi:MAG TPA: glycosyltransferase, partial [Gemmatimonadales bacterium]|nr:glycosyltransferase [Gemmatimonadales bacterium]
MASEATPPGPGTTLAVLHVAAPGAVGGLESVLALLAGGQRTAGHRVAVAAVLDRGAGESPFLAGLARANVPVHLLALPPRAYIRERRRLVALIRDTRPDIVHTHGYRADIQAGAAARRLGVPTLTTVHGFTGGGWKNRLYERLQLRSFRRFDAVVAVSTPLAARLRAAGVPPARLHVVANAAAFDPPLSRADARRQFGVNDDAFLVGWI